MTGAGSATLAFGLESSFAGSVTGAPDYYSFGRNPSVQTLSLDNQLTRLREAGAIENPAALKGNFEGAFNIEATVNEATFSQIHNVVFNNSGNGFTTGRAQPMQVLAGVEHLSGAGTNTKIRELKGAIPTEYQIEYQQGEPVTYSLTCLYADEADGSAPGSLTQPSVGGTASHHNVDVSIDGTTIEKLQSATLSCSNLYRFQRGTGPTPVEAVLSQPEVTLTTDGIYSDADHLGDAYGTGGTTPQNSMVGSSGVFDVTIAAIGTVANYELQRLKPTTYDWESLLDAETDTTESVEWVHSGQIVVT
jgi:hypothetical protein